MKKHLYLLIALILTAMTVSLTACGDDNDELGFATQRYGSLTVTYKGSGTEHYYAHAAWWRYYPQKDETYFQVNLMEHSDDLIPEDFLGFSIKGSIGNSTTLKIEDIVMQSLTASLWDAHYYNQAGGQVTVKSLKGDIVTLEFKDVKFGNRTLNGEITYTKD